MIHPRISSRGDAPASVAGEGLKFAPEPVSTETVFLIPDLDLGPFSARNCTVLRA